MNIYRNSKGCFEVLMGHEGWESYFELSRDGVLRSFYGLLLILPNFYLIAYVVQRQKYDQVYNNLYEILPLSAITITLTIYLLSFSALALIVAMVFDFQDRLRPWLITRHWCVIWLSIIIGLVFSIHSLGFISFYFANFIALLGFLNILFIDICLAKSILCYKNGPAILIGCGINIIGLSIILISIN